MDNTFNLIPILWRLKQMFFVQKLWGEKKLSKSVFGYFKTKKKKSSDGH